MQTPKLHRIAYLWPGLPQLWLRGSWAGLAVAVGFTVLANTLLLATLVYTEWLARDVKLIGFGSLASVWMLAWWLSRGERVRGQANLGGESPESAEADLAEDNRDELFREAQQVYLQNDWVATEQVLLKLLKQDSRDVESRLMLATLWRHQGRSREALRQLDRLERLEAAEVWKYEIAAEREAIAGAARQKETMPDSIDDEKVVDNKEPPSDETGRSLAA